MHLPVNWTVFSVLYLYDFLTSYKMYRNTNLHMHIAPAKIFLWSCCFGPTQNTWFKSKTNLYTIFHNFQIVNIQVFWTTVTSYKFCHVPHSRVIHTSPVVPKYNEYYFIDQKQPPWPKITYTCLIYPMLGQWCKFSLCMCLSTGLFSQFCTYTIFWPVIKCIGIPTFTCT